MKYIIIVLILYSLLNINNVYTLEQKQQEQQLSSTSPNIISDIYYPRNVSHIYKGVWTETNGDSLLKLSFHQKSGSILYSLTNMKYDNRNTTPTTPTPKNNNNNTTNTNNTNSSSDSSSDNSSSHTIMTTDFDIVEGYLILRDGVYSNNYQLKYQLYGIYEFKIGLLTILALPIADNYYQSAPNPLNFDIIRGLDSNSSIVNLKEQMNNISKLNQVFFSTTPVNSNDNNNNNNDDSRTSTTNSGSSNNNNKNNSAGGNNNNNNSKDVNKISNGNGSLSSTHTSHGTSNKLTIINSPYINDNSSSFIFIFTQQLHNLSKSEYQDLVDHPTTIHSDEHEALYFGSGKFVSLFAGIILDFESAATRMSVYRSKILNYIVMVSLSSFVQIFILIRQMDYTGTQTGASRISIYSIGMQTLLDAYLCLLHLIAGVLIEQIFNAFATAAFFQFVTFSLFEMRYLLIILKARRPQAFAEGWASLRREFSLFYLKFYTCLFGGIMILYYFSGLLNFFVFLMYSFWVPQIISNAKRSIKRPFLWKYVIGISITRLVIPLYFYGCPYNFIQLEPKYGFSQFLVFWMILQVVVLWLQSFLGPQFFIPKSMLPPKYQYYRPIPAIIRSREEGQGCVICMNDVEANDTDYMITPCEHLFHNRCLLQWMEFKMDCPTCRATLPPP